MVIVRMKKQILVAKRIPVARECPKEFLGYRDNAIFLSKAWRMDCDL